MARRASAYCRATQMAQESISLCEKRLKTQDKPPKFHSIDWAVFLIVQE